MKLYDFCTVAKTITNYVAESKSISQLYFMYEFSRILSKAMRAPILILITDLCAAG